MTEVNIYKQAARQGLRFSTDRGVLAVEDLFNLPLGVLDTLAIKLRKEVRDLEEESFIETKPASSKLVELKFEIVKDVIKTLQEEAAAKQTAKDKKEQEQKLLGLLAKKEDQHLESLSRDELLAKIQELQS